jgi:hypothetical protein
MSDCTYTPPALAESLVDWVTVADPQLVADFAVGGGELLRAGQKRWTKARYIGTDIDRDIVTIVKRDHPNWNVSVLDFLGTDDLSPNKRMAGLLGSVDVILLNPPFTSRGGTRLPICHENIILQVSQAVAFVLRAIPYLSKRGELIAILPIGSLHNQKDSSAWKMIERTHVVKIVARCPKDAFPLVSASTAIVLIRRRSKKIIATTTHVKRSDGGDLVVEVLRGKIQMHTLIAVETKSRRSFPVVHTRQMRAHVLSQTIHQQIADSPDIRGRCILIPRVGAPALGKVVLADRRGGYCISDCVVALRCPTPEATASLYSLLRQEWPSLEHLYVGTGARFITLQRLSEWLESFRFKVVIVKTMSEKTKVVIDAGPTLVVRKQLIRKSGDQDGYERPETPKVHRKTA